MLLSVICCCIFWLHFHICCVFGFVEYLDIMFSVWLVVVFLFCCFYTWWFWFCCCSLWFCCCMLTFVDVLCFLFCGWVFGFNVMFSAFAVAHLNIWCGFGFTFVFSDFAYAFSHLLLCFCLHCVFGFVVAFSDVLLHFSFVNVFCTHVPPYPSGQLAVPNSHQH